MKYAIIYFMMVFVVSMILSALIDITFGHEVDYEKNAMIAGTIALVGFCFKLMKGGDDE